MLSCSKKKKNKSASFGFKHLEKLWTKFFVVIPFRPSMEKATALIKALPSSKVGKYVGRCCWKFHDWPDVPEIIEWSILGRKQYKHSCFFSESHLLVVRVGRCVSHCQKKTQKFSSVPSEFWCVFSGWKSRTKEPNSWSSIEHFSVFVAIGVWRLGPRNFQVFDSLDAARAAAIAAEVQGEWFQSRGLWKCTSPKFRGDWKNITLSVGLTWWLIIKLFLWVYLGDSITKPLHPRVFCCFAHGILTGCTERPFGSETTQLFWAGRKQMLVCSAAWKVHTSRGARWFWWLVGVWWDLFSILGFWLGVLWFVFTAPELGGAHRPTGRLWPAGCGSARQPKPSVTTGGANSWR